MTRRPAEPRADERLLAVGIDGAPGGWVTAAACWGAQPVRCCADVVYRWLAQNPAMLDAAVAGHRSSRNS